MQAEPTDHKESSIHILSNDVLIEIFSILFDEESDKKVDTMPLQFPLSLVCQQWRELIISTPLFWNTINLYSGSQFDPTLFFERSKPALIDVHFDATSNWAIDETSRLSDIITANFSRVRTFTVSTWDREEISRIFQSIKDHQSNDNLTTLKLFARFRSISANFSHPSIDMSNIRHLELTGFPFDGFSALHNLTSLAVDTLATNVHVFQALFKSSPSLATLVIRQFGAPLTTTDHSEVNRAPVDAPSLRHLAINIGNDHSRDCECLFPSLSAPNLETLEIVYLWSAFTTHHKAILNHLKEFSNLHKLRIRSHSIWLEEDVTFLSALPATTDLEIIEYPRAAPAHQTLSYILNLSNVRSITIDLNFPPKHRMSMNLQNFSDLIHDKLPTLKCPVSLRTNSLEESVSGHPLHAMLGNMFTHSRASTEKGRLDAYVNCQRFDGDPLLWQENDGDSDDFEIDEVEDYEDWGYGEYDDDDEFDNRGRHSDEYDADDFYEYLSGSRNGHFDEYNDEGNEFEDADDDYD